MFKFDFFNVEKPKEAPQATNFGREPVLHQLADFKYQPKRISYSFYEDLVRRDLYDVMYELKQRSDLNEEEKLLLESNSDLESNVYEGGLKVWEGSYDLVKVLKDFFNGDFQISGSRKYMELGCGAGLPLCLLLYKHIQQNIPGKFVFADYNEAVLSLLTVPNILLIYLSARNLLPENENEINTDPEMLKSMVKDLDNVGIEIEIVSGAWGSQFTKLTGKSDFDLVLASETVYSLESLPSFTNVTVSALKPGASALVAAKQVYFGVGGGVIEFLRLLDAEGLHHSTVAEYGESVKRVVLEIKK